MKYIDENGILPECEDATSYQPYFSYEEFEASQNNGTDDYEAAVYTSENSDFYFAIQDIDGDGTEELLVEWYNWYAYDYGGTYTVILQYHPEHDALNCEAMIPVSQFAYETNNTRHQATFYDNGMVTSELEWINSGNGSYLCQYEYDAESDTYKTAYDNWLSYSSEDFPEVIDVWDKTEYPEINLTAEGEAGISYVGTQEFPDELDVDGDGKIYCKMGTEHLCEVTENFDFSQFKDIQDIEELNIPKGENHEIPITWSHIHTYVQTGEKSEGNRSMDAVYENLSYDFFIENYNDSNLTDEEKNNVFYAYSDLNDDGTDELICGIYFTYESDGTTETEYEKLRIYTFQNGKIYLIVCDDDENWPEYQICENGIRYMAGRGTGYRCYEFYQFSKSTKLEAVETVTFEYMDGDTVNYYHNLGGMDSGDMQEISEDEYNAFLDSYPKKELEIWYMSF